MDIDPTPLYKSAPGVVGSVLAMLRLRGAGRVQRASALIGGIACSHWGAEMVIQLWPRVSFGAAGFVLGLFGMAVLAKAFELLDELRPAALLRSVLEARGWLKPGSAAAGATSPSPGPSMTPTRTPTGNTVPGALPK